MQRLAIVLVLAGCRLHFDDRPVDAAPDAPPLQLACNTPVKLADAKPTSLIAAVGSESSIIAQLVETTGDLHVAVITLFAPDQAQAAYLADPGVTGITQIASASRDRTVVTAYTRNGTSYVESYDSFPRPISASPTPIPTTLGGPRAVAMTLSGMEPFAAITTISSANQTTVYGIDQLDELTGPLVIPAANPVASSALVNLGDRLAVVNTTTVSNCSVRTIDLAVSSSAAATGWGTANQCTQPELAYSPGRTDALLIRHDMTDGDLNHVIATRSGLTYTIPGENRLRNPGNEPRPVGVADGYWVGYETGGTLEAAHVDVAVTVGTVAMLGPLTTIGTYDVVVANGVPYAVWVQDGLEVARLCP